MSANLRQFLPPVLYPIQECISCSRYFMLEMNLFIAPFAVPKPFLVVMMINLSQS